MSNQNQTEIPERLQPEWEKRVEAEAMKFSSVIEHNFLEGLKVALVHLPNPRDPKMRHIQLDYFINALIGGMVKSVVLTANSSEEWEKFVLEEVKFKFNHVREHQATIPKESKLIPPSGLVGIDGKPVMPHG